jgi:glycine/D-amino acid oxidase-like deaminating enzyme
VTDVIVIGAGPAGVLAALRAAELTRVAVSFPTYAEIPVHVAIRAAAELRLPLGGHAAHFATRPFQDSDETAASLIQS